MGVRRLLSAAVGLVGLWSAAASAQVTTVANFDSGIGPSANHPTAPAFDTWYDITSDAFATPVASTLNGSPALRIDDGGFTNGVYIIYDAVVPSAGEYFLRALMDWVETPTGLNAIRAYSIGVKVNGAHRPATGSPDDLTPFNPATPGHAIGSMTGFTTGDDNAVAPQTVQTGTFPANAGDHLLIGFSTDLTSGNFDLNSATWNSSHVLVDNIELVLVPEPATLSIIGLTGLALRARRRRRV